MPKAASLAAEIKDSYDLEPKLIEDKGGIFDVHVDGQRIYSKHETGRFPEPHEVLDAIGALRGE